MPMPKPKPIESMDEFMQRCMRDDVMAQDFPEASQRYAVCMSQWDAGEVDKAIDRLDEIFKDV